MLNPSQFFHGTRAEIPVGGKILPSSKTGVEPNFGISDPKRAYMSTSENSAWEWSRSSGAMDDDGVYNRPWVAKVAPEGKVHEGRTDDEFTAKSALVRSRIDVMPGRQGTFPSINWNKHADVSEANHPSDADIQGGHDVYERKYRPGLFETPPEPEDAISSRFKHDPKRPDPDQGKLF